MGLRSTAVTGRTQRAPVRDDAQQLPTAFGDPVLIPQTVNNRVNSIRNNGPE